MLQRLGRERGTTTLMVTHDNRILALADRILRMEDGRLVGEGECSLVGEGTGSLQARMAIRAHMVQGIGKTHAGFALMEIRRVGSQPSGKGSAEYFTGTVRIDPLFSARSGPRRRRLRHLRAGRAHRLAHPSLWPDADHHRRRRLGAA